MYGSVGYGMAGSVVLDTCTGLLLEPLKPAVGEPVLGVALDEIG